MIPMRMLNPEVYYAPAGVVVAGAEEIDFLLARAAETPRQRCRLCAHPDERAVVHEMLIVHKADTYVPPHRHLHRSESLFVVRGEVVVGLYDAAGELLRRHHLAAAPTARASFIRFDDASYHSLCILTPWLVFWETAQGPFDRASLEVAPWAPDAQSPAGREAIARLHEALMAGPDQPEKQKK